MAEDGESVDVGEAHVEKTCAKPSESGGGADEDPLYVFKHMLEKTVAEVPAAERVTKEALEVRVALLRATLHAPPKRAPFLVLCAEHDPAGL